jgi:hypothetical protein
VLNKSSGNFDFLALKGLKEMAILYLRRGVGMAKK